MVEAVQLQLAVEVATGAAARTGLFLGRGFSVVVVDPDAAACAAIRERYSAEIIEGRLRVVERAPAGVSALGDPHQGAASGMTPRGIDWPDLQLMVGTPYYLRIGSAEPPMAFLGSMSCSAGLPALVSVACPAATPLEVLSAFGFQEFVITASTLAPEFVGLGARVHRWMQFAEARETHALAVNDGSAGSLVCHARR